VGCALDRGQAPSLRPARQAGIARQARCERRHDLAVGHAFSGLSGPLAGRFRKHSLTPP
jgi:hypothetical protein